MNATSTNTVSADQSQTVMAQMTLQSPDLVWISRYQRLTECVSRARTSTVYQERWLRFLNFAFGE